MTYYFLILGSIVTTFVSDKFNIYSVSVVNLANSLT
ncbi:hypothetical protein C8N46_101208 [Kordia periserrulae]|uniref:Uncharacterized protein n=1 Tax=Kordia periserrulae TaxID=701523 RepID=A0A2T6C5N4_9FLAO|nr:hypothetical protein C8N46_101208 [Kordia periserrulae]